MRRSALVLRAFPATSVSRGCALLTDAVEVYPALLNRGKTTGRCRALQQRNWKLHIHVFHFAAGPADNVLVCVEVAVVERRPAAVHDLIDQTRVPQRPKGPVHSAQADPGKEAANALIDLSSIYVPARLLNRPEYGLTLLCYLKPLIVFHVGAAAISSTSVVTIIILFPGLGHCLI